MSTQLMKPGPEAAAVEVRVERAGGADPAAYLVHVGDRTHEVELRLRQEGCGWLHVHGRVIAFHVVHRPGEVEVWVDGRRHVLEKVATGPRRRAGQAASSSEVKAPMPGTVLKILVAAGDVVVRHQPLVIMESMKMEMTLSATRDGRIGGVSCREGELVTMGTVLVRFEERASG